MKIDLNELGLIRNKRKTTGTVSYSFQVSKEILSNFIREINDTGLPIGLALDYAMKSLIGGEDTKNEVLPPRKCKKCGKVSHGMTEWGKCDKCGLKAAPIVDDEQIDFKPPGK